MTRVVRIREEAEAEILAAKRWYEDKAPGLGEQFLLCVEATMALVGRHPERFRKVHGQVRRALVRRFPFAVLCVVEADAVHVLAVFHGSRDPSQWHRRSD